MRRNRIEDNGCICPRCKGEGRVKSWTKPIVYNSCNRCKGKGIVMAKEF